MKQDTKAHDLTAGVGLQKEESKAVDFNTGLTDKLEKKLEVPLRASAARHQDVLSDQADGHHADNDQEVDGAIELGSPELDAAKPPELPTTTAEALLEHQREHALSEISFFYENAEEDDEDE